jgi:hypothetical protein
MTSKKLATAAIAGLGVALYAASGFASSINFTENNTTSGTTGVTVGNTTTAVITSVITTTGETGDGNTSTRNVFLLNDGTGSIDVFGPAPAGDTYVPTLGDAVQVTGEWDPFDGIPELETVTALTKVSSGNPVPAPLSETIPALSSIVPSNANSASNNLAISGYLVTVSNVTLTSTATSFPAAAGSAGELSLTATDASSNTLSVFFDPPTYYISDPLAGTVIPTGPVNITGLVDVFDSAPEMILFSISPVPEPATLGLVSLGALALIARRPRIA